MAEAVVGQTLGLPAAVELAFGREAVVGQEAVEQTVRLDLQEKAGVVVERLLEGALQEADIRGLERDQRAEDPAENARYLHRKLPT